MPHRKRLEDWYAKRNEMPERIIELASYHAMLGCVVAGMGVALDSKKRSGYFSRQKVFERPPVGKSREPGVDRAHLAQERRLRERSGLAGDLVESRFASQRQVRAPRRYEAQSEECRLWPEWINR